MRGGTRTRIRRNLPLLMHTYPSITPWNVYDIEMSLLDDLIAAATPKED